MSALDLYIHHPSKPGQVFNVQTSLIKGVLVFKTTRLVWNEERQENDETKLPNMTAQAFGVWDHTMRAAGWRAQA